MASGIVTPNMQAKAERLAEMVPTFPRGRDRQTGIQFVIVPGSEPGVGHRTNGLGCTCLGHDQRGVCTHSLAVTIHQTRASMARIEAAQRLRAERGVCQQMGCILTATVRGGRCADHNAVILEGVR